MGLYSTENKALFEIRKNIMDKILYEMTKEVLRDTIDTVVGQYIRKRAMKGIEDPEDIFDAKSLDPLAQATKSVMDGVLRKELTGLLKEELTEVGEETILKDYVLEASFIPYFNNVLLKQMVEETANESLEMILVGEVVEDMVDKVTEDAIYEETINTIIEQR